MDKWTKLKQKVARLQRLMTLALFLLVSVMVTGAVDYYGADQYIRSAKVVYKKFILQTDLDLVDPCGDSMDEDCIYITGHSQTRYGLVAIVGDRARVFPVPKSYFYTIEENHHIPIQQKRGFLTGLLYSERIDYPLKSPTTP